MQRRNHHEADDEGDGVDSCLGQAEGGKQRADELGHRGFAQPAEGERCQRDAKLAGRQVRVHVVGDKLGVLGALATFVDKDFNLRLSHAHERELGGDEERIHEQEKQDKKQTDCWVHNCGWSSFV